jgi:general bacterial porin, GBP family
MFKKITVALALIVAGVTTPAHAQSNVTLFGLMDLGVEAAWAGNGRVLRLQSGQWFGSRLGVRGTEDLGDGLSALFVLEAGITADVGAGTQFGTNTGVGGFWDRQAYLGLQGRFGRLTAGRHYSLTDTVKGTVEPFVNGTSADTSPIRALNPSRTDNSIIYSTPTLVGGLTAGLMISSGNEYGDTATTSGRSGREASISLAYVNGPLYVATAYDMLYGNAALTPNRSAVQKIKSWIVGATYDFTVVKMHAWVNGQKADAVGSGADTLIPRDTFAWALGATIPVSDLGKLRVAYAARNDKTALDRDASKWGLGYFYDLSKRTTLYTAYSKLTNVDRFAASGAPDGAGISLGSGAAAGIALADRNADPRSFNLGVRHSF